MVLNTRYSLRHGVFVAAHVCAALALGNASSGCAFDTPPSRSNFGGEGNTAGASGAGTSGSASGGTGGMVVAQGGSPAGSSGSAGTPDTTAGSSSGGALGVAGSGGSNATAGSTGTAGSATGGTSSAGAGQGGSGGKSGSAGNAGSSGNAGSGGAGTVLCSDHPLPAKQSWTLTASSSDTGGPVANAIDGNLGTRWTTGKDQNNDWLQVDFGAQTALDSVTLMLGDSAGDYPRSYEVRVSNTSQNTAVAPLVTGAGQQATDTQITFTTPAVGRYLLISQIGSTTGIWWSVAELNIACTH